MASRVTIRRPVLVAEISVKRTVAAPSGRRSVWRCRVFALRALGVAAPEARLWSKGEMARISELMRAA